jgi:uncharacterized protein YllA (UPF0747 family)
MVSNNYTLKLVNIFDNDTSYKDVYDYILKRLLTEYSSFKDVLSRKLIKKIVMPNLYGQKTIKMLDECEKLLEKNEI